ncbi:MAG: hypothetical protein GX230_07060 [Lentisphaerae bacterium]|nr:hypothetical protein [Lentisphaerota bacterium]
MNFLFFLIVANRLATKDTPVSLGIISIPDVRVSPIIASRWGQTTVNGKNVYNYYTTSGTTTIKLPIPLMQKTAFYRVVTE